MNTHKIHMLYLNSLYIRVMLICNISAGMSCYYETRFHECYVHLCYVNMQHKYFVCHEMLL